MLIYEFLILHISHIYIITHSFLYIININGNVIYVLKNIKMHKTYINIILHLQKNIA